MSGQIRVVVGIDIDDVVFLIAYIFSGGPAPDPGCCLDCPSMVTDYDGNSYSVVKIGSQCWMAENLKVTHYRNGDPIPHVTDDGEWGGLSTGAYCEYDNDPANVETYGRIYNWHAVDDSRNIAPEGWHVPTDDEWKQLEAYLGIRDDEIDAFGERGRYAGLLLGKNGGTGFEALYGGYHNNCVGKDGHKNWESHLWTSSITDEGHPICRVIAKSTGGVGRVATKCHGGSAVRYVKDSMADEHRN